MSRLLAIDPGPVESAYAEVDVDTCRPVAHGKVPNATVLSVLRDLEPDVAVRVEMVASYGMPVGAEVFETCVWIGRFIERTPWALRVFRRDVKLHVCHDSRAKDSNITQALVDRFAPGQPNRGKGTKAQPGWFHGFAADVWQAYALAVTEADRLAGRDR